MDYGIDFIEYLSIRVIMYNKVEKEIFNFDFVNLVQVDFLLFFINSCKFCGYDMLYLKLFKLFVFVIVFLVLKIINFLIILCCYLVRWKMG